MQYRKLGRTNFEVGDIGYGAWGIGGKQWLGGTDDESLQILMPRTKLRECNIANWAGPTSRSATSVTAPGASAANNGSAARTMNRCSPCAAPSIWALT